MQGSEDKIKVSFPASADFTRIGRVALCGLAMRVGVEISKMDELTNITNKAVEALQGSGSITLNAYWEQDSIQITFENPDANIDEESIESILNMSSESTQNITVKQTLVEFSLLK